MADQQKERGEACDSSMEPANERPTDRVTAQENVSVCIHGCPERGTRGRGVTCFLPEHQGDVRSCPVGSWISKCKLEERGTSLTQGAGPAGCPNVCTICKKSHLTFQKQKRARECPAKHVRKSFRNNLMLLRRDVCLAIFSFFQQSQGV